MATIIMSCFVILIFAGAGQVSGQSFEKTFARAEKLYSAGRYDSTIAVIKEYLKEHGREPSTEYIVPLLLEALVRQNDAMYFRKLVNIYRRKFQESVFLPRISYLEGIVFARDGEFKKAIQSFSDAISGGLTPELDSLTEANVLMICSNSMAANELSSLVRDADLSERVREIIEYCEISKLYESGHGAKAKKRSEEFKREYNRSPFLSDVRKIGSKSKTIEKNSLQVGLLAPISGENADIGKFVVQGVQLAVDAHNKSSTPQVDLVIMDTRGNMVETAKKVRELRSVHDVEIIIGPVLSANATVAAAAIMGDERAVMITPTATDDGIAKLGKNIFQMNVTLGILGKRIARYAWENLNIKEFGVIAPLSEYGRILSGSFREEVARLGGTILAEEFFDEGTNDFRLQFESLRSKLAEREWEQMALMGRPEYGRNAHDRKAKEAYLADSTIEIGGLFIPAESDDVSKIASQVYFHRIRTQLLGSNGWHTNATIMDGKRYVENAVFSTNFETDTNNDRWIGFSKIYFDRFRENPDRVAAPLGYDAANLILEAVARDSDPRNVADYLRSVKNHHGVSGTISFDENDGVNSEAAIMKISNKKFIRVQ